jgi:hypothetical protein
MMTSCCWLSSHGHSRHSAWTGNASSSTFKLIDQPSAHNSTHPRTIAETRATHETSRSTLDCGDGAGVSMINCVPVPRDPGRAECPRLPSILSEAHPMSDGPRSAPKPTTASDVRFAKHYTSASEWVARPTGESPVAIVSSDDRYPRRHPTCQLRRWSSGGSVRLGTVS